MKTAVSIPDEIFEKVARHAPDEVTDAMNRVCDRIGDSPAGDTAFRQAAARNALEKVEW